MDYEKKYKKYKSKYMNKKLQLGGYTYLPGFNYLFFYSFTGNGDLNKFTRTIGENYNSELGKIVNIYTNNDIDLNDFTNMIGECAMFVRIPTTKDNFTSSDYNKIYKNKVLLEFYEGDTICVNEINLEPTDIITLQELQNLNCSEKIKNLFNKINNNRDEMYKLTSAVWIAPTEANSGFKTMDVYDTNGNIMYITGLGQNNISELATDITKNINSCTIF